MITEIELSGIKYPVLVHEDFSDTELVKYGFSVVVNGETFPMKCYYTSENLKMSPIFGIPTEEALYNIIYFELKAELFQIVYNTSFGEQCDKAAKCSIEEELYAASVNDSIFTEWLHNFYEEKDE